MGIAVSDWRLARAVALEGGLGVVSGTGIDTVLVRRLQRGDADGHLRRALAACPLREHAARLVEKYFVPGGLASDEPFALLSLPKEAPSDDRNATMAVAAFVEVFLAKEGHDRPIGMNLLEKIQWATLPTLFGAMLAGVDVVLMGAGIPSAIPGVLDKLSAWEEATLKLSCGGPPDGPPLLARLAPEELLPRPSCLPRRPAFFAIVSSHILAKTLAKKASGRVDGFVVESHVAGGHNAPPRKPSADPSSPWGPADEPSLLAMRELGRPFWLAGDRASPEALTAARAEGAEGVQVGTAFAFCEESGVTPELKSLVLRGVEARSLAVITDFQASPTGFPFKLAIAHDRPGALEAARARSRVCDLGYLRQALRDEEGDLVWRCPGEPEAAFVRKGGAVADTVNKLCLCNGLLATVGLGQRRASGDEVPILTAGESLADLSRFMKRGAYRVRDVMQVLLSATEIG